MKRRTLALLLALGMTLSLAACGGGEKTPDVENIPPDDPGYEDRYQEEDNNDSYMDNGYVDDRPAANTPARPVEGQVMAVYSTDNNYDENTVYCELLWDGDGDNMRVTFFGKDTDATVPLTTMDETWYMGSAAGDFTILGKHYGSLDLSFGHQETTYTSFTLRSGDETIYDYQGLNGQVAIQPMPKGLLGVFCDMYMNPMMVVTSEDGFRANATLYLDELVYEVKDLFNCRDIWSSGEYEQFQVKPLTSWCYKEYADREDFTLSPSYNDYPAVSVSWYRYENDVRDENVDRLSTNYYYFWDRIAPADFVSHDGDGAWGAIPFQSDLVPATDDYIVRRELQQIAYWDEGAGKSLYYDDVETYKLYAFNPRGGLVQYRAKYIMPDAAAAAGYAKYLGSWQNATSEGNVVYTDQSEHYSSYETKESVLQANLGGLTTYRERTWYEGVHSYQFEDTWTKWELYISTLPEVLRGDELMALINRFGTYTDGAEGRFRLGCDMDRFYFYLDDGTISPDPYLQYFILQTENLCFDDTGFYALDEYKDGRVAVRVDWGDKAVNVKLSFFDADPGLQSWDELASLTPDRVEERSYQYTSRVFKD